MLRNDVENGAQRQGISMEYTLSSAAKAVGVHKASIHRAIKSGKLSARRLEDGTYRIDASELSRVYEVKPPATERATAQRDSPHPPAEPPATARDGEAATVIAMLREQVEREREISANLQDTVSRLLLALAAPAKPVEPVAVETPAEDSSEVIEALRKRLEDMEASMTAAMEALERAQERASVVARAETPARGRPGLLARLMGRG